MSTDRGLARAGDARAAQEAATPRANETPFTMRSIEETLGISRGRVAWLIAAGFVTPARGPRRQLLFSFRDVVLLRTALELRAAKVPARRIVASLAKLRRSLPAELPLTGLRITAEGGAIAVRDGSVHWEPLSGQLLIDLDVAPAADGARVVVLPHRKAPRPTLPPPVHAGPDEALAHARDLESSDATAAEAIYREVIAATPDHTDAWLNLGAMLCDSGRVREALELYSKAIQRTPDSPALHFNHAIALEDSGDPVGALASYEHCLRIDPRFADAHFNAARLHERLGQPRQALRHFSAYRRLQPPRSGPHG